MESNFFGPPPAALRPTPKNRITILSIDGGGIRGIIPGVILAYLEAQLQEIDQNPNAKLADYFDVIAGTGSGGLVTTMLTTPKEPGSKEPKYTAKEIVPFYLKYAPKIFDQSWIHGFVKLEAMFYGPVYDGKDLRSVVNDVLGKETRLSDTLTNVVIPAFDIKSMRPVIFSSFKVPKKPSLNATMYNICIGTTAAPMYLPGHKFHNDDQEFNLIGGGVVANNPTDVALEEVTLDVMKHLKDTKELSNIHDQFLVLSLGAGSFDGSLHSQSNHQYDVENSSKWGALSWLLSDGAPLTNILCQARDDLVDYRISNIFHLLGCPDNYLRIQDDTVTGILASVDVATNGNLEALNQIGINLLDKPVRRPDFMTGELKPPLISAGPNRAALNTFAKQLSLERKNRVENGMGDPATKKESVIRLLKQNMGIHE